MFKLLTLIIFRLRTLVKNQIPIAGLIHCDLGRSEWPQSLTQCRQQATEYSLPLHVLKRKDGLDLLAYMWKRLRKLEGTGKPFWPSSAARYCTSDLKREPSNYFFRNCGHNLIISAEGIRAEESTARAKKHPLGVRPGVTSDYYTYIDGYKQDGKAVRKFHSIEQCLELYKQDPSKRLVLNWYPVFNMTVTEVWAAYGMTVGLLLKAREIYKTTSLVPTWWPYHPAYAFGNDRVSCMFCIMGSLNDLQVAADHDPDLLEEMILMEQEGDASFKHGWSLSNIMPDKTIQLLTNQII